MVALISDAAEEGRLRLMEQDRVALASHQTKLHKVVLSWDYLRLLGQSKVTDKKRKKAHINDPPLRPVPETFDSVEDYLSVFEPLLLEECQAQIIRGDDEGGVSECHMAALTHCEKANEFHVAKFVTKADIAETFTDNDLVLLSKEQLGGAVLPTAYACGIFEGHERPQTLRLRLYLDRESGSGQNKGSLMIRGSLQVSSLDSPWWITKLCNLSTISREYAALQSIRSLPFKDVILSAKSVATGKTANGSSHWNIPLPLFEYLKTTHNPSQMQALEAGLSREPLVLIQGPPGTGKTQTILGVLSVVLHSTPARIPSIDGCFVEEKIELPFCEKLQHWIKASPWLLYAGNPRDVIMPEDGDDGFFEISPNQYTPEVVSAKRKHRAHVLVCAPSNSALDEVVLRLITTGLHDEHGQQYIPSVVRVGLHVHHSVQSVSMDNLAEQRLKSIDRSLAPRGASGGSERDRIRLAILEEAAIVCCTLSFSGASVFSRMRRGFDVVVIDEAAQAVEPSTLVPLAHGCRQAILVGDPVQLPATVISDQAVNNGYGTSLFKRFQKAGYPVQMLKTQYRMHPQIRQFPSKEFYSEALEDGESVEEQTKRPWHEYRCFGPFAFFDVPGKESQQGESGSYVNTDEIDFVLVLYRHMIANYPELKGGPYVSVISPYKLQVKMLRERLVEVLGKDIARLIDVNTVDGFQGREKDVAIFSCVRADKEKGIGFLSDFRRMNVGLTRARASMLVVGSASVLKKDKHWSNLIGSAQERRRFFKVTKPYHALFNEESLNAMKKLDEVEKQLKDEQSAYQGSDTENQMDVDQLDDGQEAVENFGDFDDGDE